MTASPIQAIVLKVHSLCNLACDHCYIYEHADQSWRSRPALISGETIRQVARRIAEHTVNERLDSVAVILHGGEPLLVGPTRLRHICAELTRILSPVTTPDLRIHTNGVRLKREHLEIFREFGVRVGVSLDGDRAANDRHRLDRRGRSSHDRTLRAIELLRLPEYRHLFLGLLCTVDVANDPVTVHDALTALDPPRIDYLLPHSTWDNPPPGHGEGTPYADWLLKVFDRWEEQGRPMPVRTFASVLSTLRGGPSLTEAMGLAPSDLAVVETDGTFEQADSLKTAYDGAAATGYDVFRNGFAEFLEHPGVRARRLGLDGVSETCRRCPVVETCGGGLYAHRYSTERGFDNPSVFCADLRAFVEGVAERITEHALVPATTDHRELRLAQVELNRTLLARVNTTLAGSQEWDAAWRLLVRLDSDEAVSGHVDTVLAHPYQRVALHRSLDGPTDLPRLMAATTAAAVLAGVETTLVWQQPGPEVHLPTLGTVRLSRPGRLRFTVTSDGFRVSDARGDVPSDLPARWRPLKTLDLPGRPRIVIDDADPYRDCYPAPVSAPLGPGDLMLFRERLRAAYEVLHRTASGLPEGGDTLLTTITPLVAGAGLRLGTNGLGALGVAVDFEPEHLVRELPLLGRQSRLASLRQVADLTVAGSVAGRLLDEASEEIGRAAADSPGRSRARALERARNALNRLGTPLGDQLTENGTYLVDELHREWAGLHG
ncbi:FxsB family radical SAM/SPASM domain protein [Streptomyces phaeolivaceus]|uniref:FxsB family radical SAM/SPASM domain protein n=1 Tax=Streptomyces phaeolivaceus TaxID=2653200 RepID=A0A5P8K2J7_9ACTN|nr:radical SAM/SPASM protein FxsB, inactivated metallohydrolase extension form [Streptomyces phaeolivaceus]QFQ96998.1 FxsB family radical SAM/SPASM domain protein [Streptomyces phaeolivaceus]